MAKKSRTYTAAQVQEIIDAIENAAMPLDALASAISDGLRNINGDVLARNHVSALAHAIRKMAMAQTHLLMLATMQEQERKIREITGP